MKMITLDTVLDPPGEGQTLEDLKQKFDDLKESISVEDQQNTMLTWTCPSCHKIKRHILGKMKGLDCITCAKDKLAWGVNENGTLKIKAIAKDIHIFGRNKE